MEMKIKHKDKILFKALAALVVGILVISIATWLLGAFRDVDANGYLSIRSPEVRFFINYIMGETIRLPVEFQDYKSEMIADDGSRVVAGLYTDKTNLLVWDRLSEKIYTIEEPSARAAAVTSPNLDYLAYAVTNKKEQMQILNVATADSTVFWETDERISDFEWINNTMVGCTTYSSGLIFPLNSITEKHNYSIVLCDLEHNLVANRKIPFTSPKTGSVFFDSTGHYAYYLSGSNFYRVTLR